MSINWALRYKDGYDTKLIMKKELMIFQITQNKYFYLFLYQS